MALARTTVSGAIKRNGALLKLKLAQFERIAFAKTHGCVESQVKRGPLIRHPDELLKDFSSSFMQSTVPENVEPCLKTFDCEVLFIGFRISRESPFQRRSGFCAMISGYFLVIQSRHLAKAP